ncbi:ThiF family adenylyltransferase [Afipia sp. DC4300-2b1]|uniref:ThiF family adenylyltransferase n=1 Tax=Afipia sp. DC4300-2b1 TaxID=2804672 RepID=UPI003CE6A079
MKAITLTLTGSQRDLLKGHLFPGDGKEAAALILCGRHDGASRYRLLAREMHPIPYTTCVRREDHISWPVEWMDDLADRAAARGFGIVKVHSHPAGYDRFSRADDVSDRNLFPGIHALVEVPVHASVVMLPDGALFGRSVGPEGEFTPIERITVVGDDIEIYHADPPRRDGDSVGRATAAFGRQMTAEMSRLTAAIAGASGTGSVINEEFGRLGLGKIITVDPQNVERKNLNRVANATAKDAADETPKVAVCSRAVLAMELGTETVPIPENLVSRRAVMAIAEADILVGGVDSAEGRDVMNRICSAYMIPFIDMGVRIRALEDGMIDSIECVVHYLKPGGSSLLSREAYTVEQVTADALRRQNPTLYAERVREKYISGADEEMPAVISVNMTVAAMAANEFLARLYRTRNQPNRAYATTRINLSENEIEVSPEGAPCPVMGKLLGSGDASPLLGLPELSV